jgi:hypothetical protein
LLGIETNGEHDSNLRREDEVAMHRQSMIPGGFRAMICDYPPVSIMSQNETGWILFPGEKIGGTGTYDPLRLIDFYG